jgi:hypothetical protein
MNAFNINVDAGFFSYFCCAKFLNMFIHPIYGVEYFRFLLGSLDIFLIFLELNLFFLKFLEMFSQALNILSRFFIP